MVQTEYVYNALGQQVIRRLVQAGQTIHAIHDAEGNRIAGLGQQVIRRLVQAGQTIHAIHDAEGNRIAEYDYDDTTGTATLLREFAEA